MRGLQDMFGPAATAYLARVMDRPGYRIADAD